MTIVKCSIYNFREVCNLDISTIIKKYNNEVRYLWVSEANYVILLFIKCNELHTHKGLIHLIFWKTYFFHDLITVFEHLLKRMFNHVFNT